MGICSAFRRLSSRSGVHRVTLVRSHERFC
jgi:hypothetical protein